MIYKSLMALSWVVCHTPYRLLMGAGWVLGNLYYLLIKKERERAVSQMMTSLKMCRISTKAISSSISRSTTSSA